MASGAGRFPRDKNLRRGVPLEGHVALLTWDRSWPDAIPPIRAKIDAACEAEGRDPATLGRTVAILAQVPGLQSTLVSTSPTGGGEPLTGSPELIAEALRGFAREGISHVQVIHAPGNIHGIEGFAPVLEALDRG